MSISDEVHSDEEWMSVWKEELYTLGLDIDKIEKLITFIHPDCKKPNKI